MRPARRSGRLGYTAILLLLVAPWVGAEERIAQLTRSAGEVVILRAASGEVVHPDQIGGQVRNGAVFDGDVVATSAGATATLLFADCSRLEVGGDSRLSARVVDLAGLGTSRPGAARVLRTVAVRSGEVTASFVANPVVASELVAADGRMTVDGAAVRFETRTDRLEVEVLDGRATLLSRRTGLTLELPRGSSAKLGTKSERDTRVHLTGGNADPAVLRLPNGRMFRVAAASRLEVALEGFSARVTVASGQLTRADGGVLGPGQAVGYANSEFVLGPETPVTASTVEGKVEFLNPSHGLRVMIGAGFGLLTSETLEGALRLDAAGSNPGQLEVSVGNRLLSAGPGSQLSVRPVCGRVSMRVRGGTAAFATGGAASKLIFGACEAEMASVDAGGVDPGCSVPEVEVEEATPEAEEEQVEEDEEEEEERPPSCGECAVPTPAGDCQDLDALCPDETCLRDRRCSRGRCVGGRRLTSQEDPNCL